MVLPVILSGGVGSRLWPLSRAKHPKPFIKLGDGESLLQKTYRRAISISGSDEIVTVTHRDLFFYSRDQFEEVDVPAPAPKNTFLLEPVGRNTAAAIAVAAHYALDQHGTDCIMLVVPADHLIDDLEAFAEAVSEAKNLAEQGKLVTFGIEPTAPETGYGYIFADGNTVKKFVEKPDKKTAREYIANGNYFWNSGMFCMRAENFLAELLLFSPEIAEQTAKAVSGANHTSGDTWHQREMQPADFEHIQSIAVDYAVFEKSRNVAIVPCRIGWSDVGSWTELGSLYPADEHHNKTLGNVICKETGDCIIYGRDRLITTLGVKNLIISDTADALLVANKDHVQDVHRIVDELKSRDDAIYKEFPTVYCSWGTYTVLQEGPGFKLKCLEVKPRSRLSLQSHKHRSEHWVVVRGEAVVTNGDNQIKLRPNQSTYIPLGNKHRLENSGNEPLTLIEVQCGSYLGEDDIVRYG